MGAFLSATDYLALPRGPSAWLVEPIVPVGGSVVLYGEPKLGKSFGALQLACAIANGTDWLGFKVKQNGRVAYIQLDTSRSLWTSEYIEQLLGSGVDFTNVYFADRELLDCWPFDAMNESHIAKLKGELDSIHPDVVVFDTLRESHSGSENDSDDMQKVISRMTSVAHPAATIFVHHSKKPNPEQGTSTRNDLRGGYVAGRMDTIIQLHKSTMDFTGRMIEDQKLKIERQDNGFWAPVADGVAAALASLLAEHSELPVRELARMLAASTGKSEQACRGLLRRAKREK